MKLPGQSDVQGEYRRIQVGHDINESVPTFPPDSVAVGDQIWMTLALEQARQAAAMGEVPVGAVVVKNGQLIATGHNSPVHDADPTSHAEMIALRAAALALGNYRLDGCTLYVTLEPCAMCSGAMLHARLARVVYGASDPKTGAAGGVINLFEQRRLNHQTTLTSGVMAEESAALLRAFFKPRRVNTHPLRQDALRTPDDRFSALSQYPWRSHYTGNLSSLNGLRLHYLDEGRTGSATPSSSGQTTFVCLHGFGHWSYQFRHMIPLFLETGARVLAPDFIGFGRSDKPKTSEIHSFSWHRDVLNDWIESLDLRNVVLVGEGWGGLIGLTLPQLSPHRYQGMVGLNVCLPDDSLTMPAAWTTHAVDARQNLTGKAPSKWADSWALGEQAERTALSAPFPDSGHCGALKAPTERLLWPSEKTGQDLLRQAVQFWREQWSGRAMLAVCSNDRDLVDAVARFQSGVAGCAPLYVIWADQPPHDAGLMEVAKLWVTNQTKFRA